MGVRLVHLSDLHLGNDLVWRSLTGLRSWRQQASAAVTEGLAAALRELKPDYVILSGDVVNKPARKIYRQQVTYLHSLFSKANFDFRERLLIVPGNHDASMMPKKNPEDWKRLREYREFLRALFEETDVENRRVRYMRVDTERKLLFVCLDSTLKIRFPLAEGEIGRSQLAWLRRKLTRVLEQLGPAGEDYTRIAVLHHHIIPIAGAGGKGELFMQLVDAGELLQMLNEFRFQLVLHGHKHFPHTFSQTRSDGSFLTVVGAGTATCPIVEEQHGHGNNFNVLDVEAEQNRFRVTRYQANVQGEFRPVPTADDAYKLFRIVPLGFSARVARKVTTVSADGTTETKIRLEGLRVDDPKRRISQFPIRISTASALSEITKFLPDETHAVAKVETNTKSLIEGSWFFRRPIAAGSPPAFLSYSYTVKAGAAMNRQEFVQRYTKPVEEAAEFVGVSVLSTYDVLEIVVQLPETLPAGQRPRTEIWQGGQSLPLADFAIAAKYDEFERRYELKVKQPPLQHLVKVVWNLVD